MDGARPEKRRRRLDRTSAACDLCKSRKVKCDGVLPCSYCKRKGQSDSCTFSGPKTRGAKSTTNTPANRDNDVNETVPQARERRYTDPEPTLRSETHADNSGPSASPTLSRGDHRDTAVPLEARLLRDAQGKVIFIGDCAPISFLQTVRHLIATEEDAFPVQASRDSFVEAAQPVSTAQAERLIPTVHPNDVDTLFRQYRVATSGLVDLFEREHLADEARKWAAGVAMHSTEATSATNCLIFAIGTQENNETKAEAWFNHAKNMLVANLTASMHLATVQGFALVAVYLLRAFQPNGAYLYFSLAARTAYAIGLHRTEVNASFGTAAHNTRDRVWKSLRVVDQLISNLLGRPPSTSDVDCTVKYVTPQIDVKVHVLDASLQIFMIIERVVVELKGWASNWLRPLLDATAESALETVGRETAVGACQTLCSYYYGIMLLTRPFLIYELYEYLGTSMRTSGSRTDHVEKEKFADAALDAAVAFVDTLQWVMDSGIMPRRMPLVVSWLFTTSLVLAVGVLGRSGLSFEGHCKASIRCLDYFATVDPHARQYSFIVQAILKTTTEQVKKREHDLRSQRKQASSQLFGLLPLEPTRMDAAPRQIHNTPVEPSLASVVPEPQSHTTDAPFDWTIYDADFFALPWSNENDEGLQDFLQPGRQTIDGSLADIPLFPMYDQVG
ncbi:hypothetical protein MBLNU13_g04746t1 [Cladosporium sp. NU13]